MNCLALNSSKSAFIDPTAKFIRIGNLLLSSEIQTVRLSALKKRALIAPTA
jgi:hypothetical protein